MFVYAPHFDHFDHLSLVYLIKSTIEKSERSYWSCVHKCQSTIQEKDEQNGEDQFNTPRDPSMSLYNSINTPSCTTSTTNMYNKDVPSSESVSIVSGPSLDTWFGCVIALLVYSLFIDLTSSMEPRSPNTLMAVATVATVVAVVVAAVVAVVVVVVAVVVKEKDEGPVIGSKSPGNNPNSTIDGANKLCSL